MGRLPDKVANQRIMYRQPWEFFGELTLTSAQTGRPYPEATFLNNTDKPFEIHRIIPRITGLDAQGIPLATQPDQQDMLALVKALITDLGKQNPLMKASTRLRSLTKGSSELTWEWADPYYLFKSEQFQVVLDSDTFPAAATFTSLRVELTFEGFFVVIAPPSENR